MGDPSWRAGVHVVRSRVGRTVVDTGGTDGMGRAVVSARLERGDTVIAVGSTAGKGESLREEAGRLGAGDRFRFVQADLSSIKGVEAVVEDLSAHPVIDALVLCANRQSPRRVVTADGLEFCFSLYYLSRYLLGHGLRGQFDAATEPVIVNVSAPGTKLGSVDFDDLQSERRYSSFRVQAQCCRANDLLGVAHGEHPSSKARYVLYHPGFTATRGGREHMSRPAKTIVGVLSVLAAKPIGKAVAPIIDLLDAPPAAPLTAIDRGKTLDLALKTFDKAAAARLAAQTRDLVTSAVGPTRLLP